MAALLTIVLAASAALYTMAGVIHVLYLARRHFEEMARWTTRIAWGMQTLGLVVLVFHSHRLPVYSQFEFLYFFTWFVVTMYILQEVFRDTQASGVFVVPVAAVLQVAGITMPKPSAEHMLATFPASLIAWHIGVLMLGYGFFVAAFSAGALYLVAERNLRQKKWGPLANRLPSLESLDVWSGRYISVGYVLVTIGLLAGFVFAQIEWHTVWTTDPKVLFSVGVWLVYGGYLLMRKLWGWGGRKAAWWSVIGVVALLVNYLVINLFSRTHRFGV